MNNLKLKKVVNITTGKLDVNKSSANGKYPFFTCAKKAYKINTYAFDNEAVIIAGNGDLNVKYFSGKFNAYQRTYILTAQKNGVLDMKYLYYFMQNYIEILRNKAIGGVIKYIKLGYLNDAKVPFLPLAEQQKIASFLTRIEALIQKRKESIQLLDELIKSTFLDMFGNLSVGEMPLGGVRCRLGEQITLQRGKDITKKQASPGAVPVISSGGVSFHHDTSIISGPGVILGRKGSVGKVHYCEVDFWPHDTTLYIKDFKGNIPLFVYHFFNQFPISHYQASAANPSLNRNKLHPVIVGWPPKPLQDKFASTVTKIEATKAKYQTSLEELNNLFNSTAQKAFKGELNLGNIKLIEKEVSKEEAQVLDEDKVLELIQSGSFEAKDYVNEKQNYDDIRDMVLKLMDEGKITQKFTDDKKMVLEIKQ